MRIQLSTIVIGALLLAGCNRGTLVVDETNSATGISHRTIYTPYYDDGAWIIEHHLGMSVVVDHEKKDIPGIWDLKAAMGALGPDDTMAKGKVTIYIWDRDNSSPSVRIVRIKTPNSVLEPSNKTFVGVQDERTGGEIGEITVTNYGTTIPMTVEYLIDGNPRVMNLDLHRRTKEEGEKYFGENGIPPYPWFHDQRNKEGP